MLQIQVGNPGSPPFLVPIVDDCDSDSVVSSVEGACEAKSQ